MKHVTRVTRIYAPVYCTIVKFLPWPLWRFRFVLSWADKLAKAIADRLVDQTAEHVKEAWEAGWDMKESHDNHFKDRRCPMVMHKDVYCRSYVKVQGWIE